MQARHSYARAHEGPGGLLNPTGETVTNLNSPRVDAGSLLSSAEFDRLMDGKFGPRRHEDFVPTIAVEYAAHCAEVSDFDCEEVIEPERDSEWGAIGAVVTNARLIAWSWVVIAVVALAAWSAYSYVRSFL